jgi:hypothetical protein
MTIEVYTVSRSGVVTAPRAVVNVPRRYEPGPELRTTQWPACTCPFHRGQALTGE